MRAAFGAGHFIPCHPQTGIAGSSDIFSCDRSPETGPSRPRLELCFRTEQCVIAADAAVDALFVQVVVLAGERSFRALLARDLELQRGQLLLPLGIGLTHFLDLSVT